MTTISHKKVKHFGEMAYILGLLLLSLGVALVSRSDFGVSMIVASPYLISLKYSNVLTFGMAEYIFQGLLLLLMIILTRKIRLRYFLSFVTVLIYGLFLDLFVWILGFLPEPELLGRVVYFIIGTASTIISIAFFFRTYLPPAMYECFVKEVSMAFRIDTAKFKSVFDVTCLLIGVILSFVFFGRIDFKVIGIGTLITTIINGTSIGLCGKFLDKHIEFDSIIKKP